VFVLFPLAIVLSVLHQFTVSEYPFGIFKLFMTFADFIGERKIPLIVSISVNSDFSEVLAVPAPLAVLLLNERNIIWNPVTYTYKNNIDKAWHFHIRNTLPFKIRHPMRHGIKLYEFGRIDFEITAYGVFFLQLIQVGELYISDSGCRALHKGFR
jgi:hypothetical protein